MWGSLVRCSRLSIGHLPCLPRNAAVPNRRTDCQPAPQPAGISTFISPTSHVLRRQAFPHQRPVVPCGQGARCFWSAVRIRRAARADACHEWPGTESRRTCCRRSGHRTRRSVAGASAPPGSQRHRSGPYRHQPVRGGRTGNPIVPIAMTLPLVSAGLPPGAYKLEVSIRQTNIVRTTDFDVQ